MSNSSEIVAAIIKNKRLLEKYTWFHGIVQGVDLKEKRLVINPSEVPSNNQSQGTT